MLGEGHHTTWRLIQHKCRWIIKGRSCLFYKDFGALSLQRSHSPRRPPAETKQNPDCFLAKLRANLWTLWIIYSLSTKTKVAFWPLSLPSTLDSIHKRLQLHVKCYPENKNTDMVTLNLLLRTTDRSPCLNTQRDHKVQSLFNHIKTLHSPVTRANYTDFLRRCHHVFLFPDAAAAGAKTRWSRGKVYLYHTHRLRHTPSS